MANGQVNAGRYGVFYLDKRIKLSDRGKKMYKQIRYRTGAVIETIKCIPRGCRKGEARQKQTKTPEEIQAANQRQAARKLARKINANFRPGDWHITLTYRKEERPSREAAQKALSKFLAEMRKRYKAAGHELKYIAVTEYASKAIHHHIIINHINTGTWTTTDAVRRIWKGKGNPKFVSLYDNGEYQTLADYLIKETEKTFRDPKSPVRQRYSCSRNLVNPKPEIKMKKARTWKQNPRPLPGYYLAKESLYNGIDKFGYKYQRYLMVKLNTGPEDWTSGTWPPDKERKP